MSKWIKPSGVIVDVNETSEAAAKALGWKPAPKKKLKKAK